MDPLRMIFEYLDESGKYDLELIERKARGLNISRYIRVSPLGFEISNVAAPRIELANNKPSAVVISRGGGGRVCIDLADPECFSKIETVVSGKIHMAFTKLSNNIGGI